MKGKGIREAMQQKRSRRTVLVEEAFRNPGELAQSGIYLSRIESQMNEGTGWL